MSTYTDDVDLVEALLEGSVADLPSGPPAPPRRSGAARRDPRGLLRPADLTRTLREPEPGLAR